MQRELAADRAARCAELEGIIRELQKNMEARPPCRRWMREGCASLYIVHFVTIMSFQRTAYGAIET